MHAKKLDSNPTNQSDRKIEVTMQAPILNFLSAPLNIIDNLI